MHLQDARCMNSFSPRPAGRLPLRVVPLSRDGGAGGPRQSHLSARVSRLGVLLLPGVTHDEAGLRIMNITGDVPSAGGFSPAIQGIPVGRPEVSTLTVTLGELASRGRVLSLNVTKPNHLYLRVLLSASPPVRRAGLGGLWTVCAAGGGSPRAGTAQACPHPLPGGADGHLPHRISLCANVCVCVCVYAYL